MDRRRLLRRPAHGLMSAEEVGGANGVTTCYAHTPTTKRSSSTASLLARHSPADSDSISGSPPSSMTVIRVT